MNNIHRPNASFGIMALFALWRFISTIKIRAGDTVGKMLCSSQSVCSACVLGGGLCEHHVMAHI